MCNITFTIIPDGNGWILPFISALDPSRLSTCWYSPASSYLILFDNKKFKKLFNQADPKTPIPISGMINRQVLKATRVCYWISCWVGCRRGSKGRCGGTSALGCCRHCDAEEKKSTSSNYSHSGVLKLASWSYLYIWTINRIFSALLYKFNKTTLIK